MTGVESRRASPSAGGSKAGSERYRGARRVTPRPGRGGSVDWTDRARLCATTGALVPSYEYDTSVREGPSVPERLVTVYSSPT